MHLIFTSVNIHQCTQKLSLQVTNSSNGWTFFVTYKGCLRTNGYTNFNAAVKLRMQLPIG